MERVGLDPYGRGLKMLPGFGTKCKLEGGWSNRSETKATEPSFIGFGPQAILLALWGKGQGGETEKITPGPGCPGSL